jgi:hypothetical protein
VESLRDQPGGTTPNGSTALGWGNTALTAGLFLYWAAAVRVAAMIPGSKGSSRRANFGWPGGGPGYG